MADPTLDDLLKDKTKEDFFDELVDAAVEEQIPETAWQPGEPMRFVMGIVARVLAALWALILPALRAIFLDRATEAWLTLIAWAIYGVKRKGATAGQATLTVENRGSTFYASIAAGQIRVKNGTTGKTFTNVSAGGPLAAWPGTGAYPTLDLTFRADEAGTASDTFAGEISTEPVTAPSGVFPLTNATAILGTDEESDPDLRARCKAAPSATSPAGPKLAYQYVALSTQRDDGTYVDVTRVRVVDIGNCQLEVYLAGSSGPTDGDMNTAGSDVFLVYAALLSKVLPTGMTLYVYPAATVEVGDPLDDSTWVQISVYVPADSGLTKDEAEAAADAAIAKYLASFPIGGQRKTNAMSTVEDGYLYWSEVAAKASESADLIIAAEHDRVSDLAVPYGAVPVVHYTVTAYLATQ